MGARLPWWLGYILLFYFTPISQMNPYNLRSSGNYRPVYPRTNTCKFSIKHIELGTVFHLTFDPRFLSISLKKAAGTPNSTPSIKVSGVL